MYRRYPYFVRIWKVPYCAVKALQRLTLQEQYDRSYRFRRASQASVLHAPLPKSEWTKVEEVCFYHLELHISISCSQDVRYLKPLVLDVAKEDNERKMWDSITIGRK